MTHLMDGQTEQGKSISEQLAAVIRQLSTDQVRFVIARQEFATDKEAAEAIGVKPNTVYQWKSRDGAPLDEAVRLMAADGIVVATELRRRNLAKAMLVKAGGLEERDPRIRQAAATEIIEWELGKATQRTQNESDDRLHIIIGIEDAGAFRQRAMAVVAEAGNSGEDR